MKLQKDEYRIKHLIRSLEEEEKKSLIAELEELSRIADSFRKILSGN